MLEKYYVGKQLDSFISFAANLNKARNKTSLILRVPLSSDFLKNPVISNALLYFSKCSKFISRCHSKERFTARLQGQRISPFHERTVY